MACRSVSKKAFTSMRFALLKRFLAAYYVANFACIATYFLLRHAIDWTGSDAQQRRGYMRSPDHLWHWEKRAFWMLLALTAGRYLQRATIDTYIAETFSYWKLSAVILLCSADGRLGTCLIVVYVLSFLLFTQPRYEGPQQVDILTPAALDSDVLSTAPSAPLWFLMFTASWSSACAQAQATFAELSLEYSSGKLRFAELDVGRWPKVAKRMDISIESIPHQLPAFFLFKHGKLVKRLPLAGESWEKKGKLKYRLVKEFDLDMVLASGLTPQ